MKKLILLAVILFTTTAMQGKYWPRESLIKSLKNHERDPLEKMGQAVEVLREHWSSDAWLPKVNKAFSEVYQPATRELLKSINNSINSRLENLTIPRRSARFQTINRELDSLETFLDNIGIDLITEARQKPLFVMELNKNTSNIDNSIKNFKDALEPIKEKTNEYLATKGE